MKKLLLTLALLFVAFILPACRQSEMISSNSSDSMSDAKALSTSDTERHSPYDSTSFIGMDYLQVEDLFHQAGFENVITYALDDIDSNSDIDDGAIIAVNINGTDDYSSQTAFDKKDEVVIRYHNIPKISVPITAVEDSLEHYMDVGRAFFEAGFKIVETDEVYDLPADSESKTVIAANGQSIGDKTQLPFDSKISVVRHYPVSQYPVAIVIDFRTNWLFSKYDIDVKIDDAELGSLTHGEDTTYRLSLTAGEHELVFSNANDDSVAGNIMLLINSETEAAYHIICNRKDIGVEETNLTRALTEDNLLMPFSSWHYLRKECQSVVEEMKDLGFSNVAIEPTFDYLWMQSEVNSVVSIAINGKTSFEHDEMFDKTAPVTVYYHIPNFSFDQLSINVTEKDSFELNYSLTSGDSIDSIIFEIDNSDVLQRNENGTYTALIPGIATVTASSGGHICSQCTVEVTEIIVPIEKIIFESESINVSVGSFFGLKYKIYPENANYTDYSIQLSNSFVELEEDNTFYANEAGNTEVLFYQDDRLLGSCVVQATFVDIDELVFEKTDEELFVGETLDLSFTIFPENATTKGISVVSSNSNVVDVLFDERGASTVKVCGIAKGNADVTITTPSGTQYTYSFNVKEVNPAEIVITLADPDQRIEVGTPILLNIVWQPDNTTIKELSWTSSNKKAIKIDQEGNLQAVGLGTSEIVAKHKTGATAKIKITVEPTLVKEIDLKSDWDSSQQFVAGKRFILSASVLPENATNKKVSFSSADESVAKVNNKGQVIAVGAGSTEIIASSPDGPTKSFIVEVSPSPQRFRITWRATCTSNNHVGNNWSNTFEVNNKPFNSGSSIVLDPDSSFSVYFRVEETDQNPDVGYYRVEFHYSEELCKNGYTTSQKILVKENGGRYSGNHAVWSLDLTITPVK